MSSLTVRLDAGPAGDRETFLGVRLLIVAGWLQGVLPFLLLLRQRGGRGVTDVAVNQTLTGLAAASSQILSLGMLIGTVALVIHHARPRTRSRGAALLLVLAPWAVIILLTVHAGGQARYSMLLYAFTGLALWLIAPPIRVLTTLGWLTISTAALALVMGQWTPFGLVRSDAFGDKVFIGNALLAGPYSNSNVLGMVLALGLPAVFLVKSHISRSAGIGLILWALVWSASRTSIAAALVVVTLWLLCRLLPRRAGRLVAGMVIAAGVAVVMWLPFHATSITEYNYRGQIWLASRATWQQHRWIGAGPDYYRAVAQSSNDFGRVAFHGHNLAMHLLTVGGILLAATVGVTLAAVSRRALRLARNGVFFPALFVVAFVYVSALELPTDFRDPSPPGWVVWLSLALCLVSRESAEGQSIDGGGAHPPGGAGGPTPPLHIRQPRQPGTVHEPHRLSGPSPRTQVQAPP